MHPIHLSSDSRNQLNILGIPMFIRIRGQDTNGTVAAVESHDLAGGGPPPHIHTREDETFQILEGEYEFTVGNDRFRAKQGDILFAPRNIPHTYRYVGNPPGRLLCIISPAGFEGFFQTVGALSPQEQQNIPRVLEIAQKFGLQILPPPNP